MLAIQKMHDQDIHTALFFIVLACISFAVVAYFAATEKNTDENAKSRHDRKVVAVYAGASFLILATITTIVGVVKK